MRSEVKLDSNYYKLIGLPTQQLANQMASKVGQGSSEYGDLTNWSAWIQDDWQDGVGNLRPAMGNGILYSEAETRVPNQIILGIYKMSQFDTITPSNSKTDCRYTPNNMVGTFTCGSALTTTKAAIAFTTPGTLNSTTFWAHVWIKCAAGTGILFEVRNNSSGSPGSSVLTSATATQTTTFPGYSWMGVQLAFSGTLSTSTQYWLCVSTTSGTFDVGYGTTTYDVDSKLLISGTWTAQTGKYMMYLTNAGQFVNSIGTNKGAGFFRFTSASDTLYLWIANRIYKFDNGNLKWTLVGTVGGNITSVGQMNGVMYFADNAPLIASNYTMDTTETITNVGFAATQYAEAGGYIWQGVDGTTVGYSSDGSTFTSTAEMVVGTTDRYITGMAILGSEMCVSTNEGLYRITEGDFAVPVLRWGSRRLSNGMQMVNHDGALYAIADNRVYRFTQDLQRQDIWLSREDDFIAGRIGKPVYLCSCNSWLLVYCADAGGTSKPTIWAFQNEHWHNIAVLPDSAVQGTASDQQNNYAMYYDTTLDRLWILSPQGVTYRIYIPGTAINPYNDTTQNYVPSSWVEWDWFDSPVREADKDYDSVAILGENISSTTPVAVYWKDDASTDWELLGTCTSNYTELRWTLTGGTRPNTKRFKLGIRLNTSSTSSTPRIRAIRVKYHLMVRDWYRWNLVIDCSGRSGAFQESDNGTRNTLTATQIKDAIATLSTQVAPFVYQDVDGKQYEVKITDASFTYTKYEYIEATSTEWWEGTWSLVLEQVTTGTYA
jgi:hypothetical protein